MEKLETVGVSFNLDVANYELLKIVSLITGIPQVKLCNNALHKFLKEYIKEQHLEEDVEWMKKRIKKKKDQKK